MEREPVTKREKKQRNMLGEALLAAIRAPRVQSAPTIPVPAALIDPKRPARPSRFTPDLERAHQGIMPLVPRFAPAIEERLGRLKRTVTRAAREHNLTELREATFPVSSGSRKKLERYRQLAIIATEARIAALAARRTAAKR